MMKYFVMILLFSFVVSGCFLKKEPNTQVTETKKCDCPICSLMVHDKCPMEGEKTECKDYQCTKMEDSGKKCAHHGEKKTEEADCKDNQCTKKEKCEKDKADHCKEKHGAECKEHQCMKDQTECKNKCEGKDNAKCFVPHIKEITGFKYLSLPFKGPFELIPQKFNELAAYATKNQLMVKQTLGVYHSDPSKTQPADLENEVGFILNVEFTPEENSGFKINEVKASKMVVMVHKGPFEKVGETYAKIFQFIGEQKLVPAGAPIEFYMNCPKVNQPENLMTKVMVPIAD